MSAQQRAAWKSALASKGGHRIKLRELRELPPTIDVATAAGALGFGRSTCYESIRAGDFPVKTITVRGRVRVLTADLIRVLEGGGDAA